MKRLECFIKAAESWRMEEWECAAYTASIECPTELQKQNDKDCSERLGSYIYSASQQRDKYCATGKDREKSTNKAGPESPSKHKKPRAK
jgi:hypothetical protein